MTPKQLREQADQLFSKRGRYMMLQQEIAEHFYPERADFTLRREPGDNWADNLASSFPLIVRRDLGDQLSVMLRPTQKQWFHTVPQDSALETTATMRYLEYTDQVMRRAMYDQVSLFTRATKEGDHDFATFGQCVISIELGSRRDHLLYRCWHIRDVVWMEGVDGTIVFIARKWEPGAAELLRTFPRGTFDPKVSRLAQKDPFATVRVMHLVCDAEFYDADARGRPRWSVWYDCENNAVIEATPIWGRHYIIPRWQTVSGSQYAYSPATIVALPEARLIQAMTLTLLDAGEMVTRPPMIATKDAVRSDMGVYPGGVTWVDYDYDERMGEALRPLTIDAKGLPFGLEVSEKARGILVQAFFLNKLRAFNPTEDPEMTAFQAGQIVQEYIRGALPLFEPMEMAYNGAMCEETFDLLRRNGAFGPETEVPEELRETDVQFRFESPLHDVIDQQKGLKLLEAKQLLAEAAAMDPAARHVIDAVGALRDALSGIKTPAKWVRSLEETDALERAERDAKAQQGALAAMQQGADVAETLGSARQKAAEAQILSEAA